MANYFCVAMPSKARDNSSRLYRAISKLNIFLNRIKLAPFAPEVVPADARPSQKRRAHASDP